PVSNRSALRAAARVCVRGGYVSNTNTRVLHTRRGSATPSLVPSGAAPIELGALTRLAVESEGPLLAGRVRAREDPVLPRGEPPEDLGLERLGPDEAQARFHAGERVGAHRGALLDRKPHLVVPVDVVRSEGHEARRERLFGAESSFVRQERCDAIVFAEEPRLEPRQTGAH